MTLRFEAGWGIGVVWAWGNYNGVELRTDAEQNEVVVYTGLYEHPDGTLHDEPYVEVPDIADGPIADLVDAMTAPIPR